MRNGWATRFFISMVAGFNVGLAIAKFRNHEQWQPFAIIFALLVIAWMLSYLEGGDA